MREALVVITSIACLFVGLPLIILWIRDRVARAWSRYRDLPDKLAEERRTYEDRLLRPDWAFYERHLQRPAPEAVCELYADRALVTLDGLEYSDSHELSTFNPLDAQGLIDARPWMEFEVVPIATSIFGDPIYLRPGPSEPDTVYITYHDSDPIETAVFASSVASMLEQIRRVRGAM